MRQTILTAVVVIAIGGTGFFVYRFFSAGTLAETENAKTPVISDERLTEYRKIEGLKPDLGIFSDPSFRALFSPFSRAGTATTTGVRGGRTNPFVPF